MRCLTCALCLVALCACRGEPAVPARAAEVEPLPFEWAAQDGVRLTVERRAHLVELVWTIEGPRTELVLRATAPGLTQLGLSSEGFQFADTSGRLWTLRPPTWTDAAGHTQALEARYTDDGLELVVPSALIASAAYPISVRSIATDDVQPAVRWIPPPRAGFEPLGLACNDESCLAVFDTLYDPHRVHLARFSARDGAPTVHTQTTSSPVSGIGWGLRIGTDGTDFLVAGPRDSERRGPYVVRVRGRDGIVLGTRSLWNEGDAPPDIHQVLFAGGRYWLFCSTQAADDSSSSWLQSVERDLTAGPRIEVPVEHLRDAGGAACTGDLCMVGRGRFDARSGAFLEPARFPSTLRIWNVIGVDSSRFLLSTRWDSAATLAWIEPSGSTARTLRLPTLSTEPRSFALFGATMWVPWGGWLRRFDLTDGTELTSLTIDGVWGDTDIARSGAQAHVLFTGLDPGGDIDPFTAVVSDAPPSVSPRRTLAYTGAGRSSAALSIDGTNALIVFEESGYETPPEVVAARVEGSGMGLGSALRAGEPAREPHVAFGAGRHLVTWTTGEGELRSRARWVVGESWLGAAFDLPVGQIGWAGFDGRRFLVCGRDGTLAHDPDTDESFVQSDPRCSTYPREVLHADAEGWVRANSILSVHAPSFATTESVELAPAGSRGRAFAYDVDAHAGQIAVAYSAESRSFVELRGRAGLALIARHEIEDGPEVRLAWRNDRWVLSTISTGYPETEWMVRTLTPDGALSEPERTVEPSFTRSASVDCTEHHCFALSEVFDAVASRSMEPRLRTMTWGASGEACSRDESCLSGHCADGVCCDRPCGPCGACSAAAGSSADGTCEPRPAGTQCRAAIDACDAPEVCDGASTECAERNPVSCPDAGLDSGPDTSDAGARDASAPIDARSEADAGPLPPDDGGMFGLPAGGGCDCQSVPTGSSPTALALGALLSSLARRRRRGRRNEQG